VIAWGSTSGQRSSGVDRPAGRHEGGGVKGDEPFPLSCRSCPRLMKRCKEVLIPELNYEGQLANLIGHLHEKDVVRLNRTTGMPMSSTLILEKIKAMIGEGSGCRWQVACWMLRKSWIRIDLMTTSNKRLATCLPREDRDYEI